MDAEAGASWASPPAYDFGAPRPAASTDAGPSFFRSASWTADGTAILTAGEDRALRVHDL